MLVSNVSIYMWDSRLSFGIMYCLFALIVAAIATKTSLHKENDKNTVAVMKESRELILRHTNMSILATNVFDDQIHILVDKITEESGGWFTTQMSKLANETHITLISRNNSADWPLLSHTILYSNEKLSGGPNKASELSSDQVDKSLFNRKPRTLKTKTIMPYTLLHCTGEALEEGDLTAGVCQNFWRQFCQSAFIKNDSEYNMHVAVYSGPGCAPEERKIYYWHPRRSTVCYALEDGDSIWWEDSVWDTAPGELEK